MPAATAAAHADEVGLVADLTMGEVRQVARTADPDDIDAWWDRVAPGLQRTVAQGFDLTARMATSYLALAGRIAGVEVEPLQAVVDLAQIAEALRIVGPVAFKTNVRRSANPDVARRVMTDRLTGSANRLALAGSRRTIVETANASPVIARYRRVAQSGACKFCEMLAGRGAVYTSEAAARGVVGRRGKPRGTRRISESYHDSCRCFLALDWVDEAGQTVGASQFLKPQEGAGRPAAPESDRVAAPIVIQPAPAPLIPDLEPPPSLSGAALGAEPPGDRMQRLRSLVEREADADRLDVSGAQGVTEILTLPDGKFIAKTATGLDAAVLAVDREELASAVAEAIGVRAPVVYRVGPKQFYMDWIDGVEGGGITRLSQPIDQWRDSDSGRLLGLMDTITSNPDRHMGNWIEQPDGTVAGIDHGLAFSFSGVSARPDQFAGAFVEGNAWRGDIHYIPNDMSPDDMAALRPRLDELRGEFDRLGHGDWHDEMMRIFDEVASQAGGSVSRVAQ